MRNALDYIQNGLLGDHGYGDTLLGKVLGQALLEAVNKSAVLSDSQMDFVFNTVRNAASDDHVNGSKDLTARIDSLALKLATYINTCRE